MFSEPVGPGTLQVVGCHRRVPVHFVYVFQGPCSLNQLALAHSRLWDAVGGFLYIFAHMQDKLSKVRNINMILEQAQEMFICEIISE